MPSHPPRIDPYALGQTLILAPEVRPEAIAAAIEAVGLTREPEAQRTPPLVSGEPELAVWTHGGGKPVVVYTFNPVARLRVLDLATVPPAMRAGIAARLDWLDEPAVAALLGGPTPRDMLRGLWAARETGRLDLLAAVARLAAQAEPLVAQEAAQVRADLERLAEARLQALAGLRLLEAQAQPLLETLHRPGVARGLCPDATECAALFDAEVAATVAQGAQRLHAAGAAPAPPPAGARFLACAAGAGLLRWPNERSARFAQGYRRIAGWMAPERVWLTWTVQGSNGGQVRYDGLAWTGSRWVWLPKPYRLLPGLPGGAARGAGGGGDATLH